MIGGQAPHIARRIGNVEPASASLAALPDDYRSRLIANTVRMEREQKERRERRHRS